MTLLSLFMTSTGIFCFVPISQRLVESGIVPASNQWWFRRLRCALAPAFYEEKADRLQSPLAIDEGSDVFSNAKMPLYSTGDTFIADQQPATATSFVSGWSPVIVSPFQGSLAHSLLPSTTIDTHHGPELTSFASDNTLCDSCNTLLRYEIPPNHIPSVIRALALFEAQDRLPDVCFNECDIVALTNAFSMLRL